MLSDDVIRTTAGTECRYPFASLHFPVNRNLRVFWRTCVDTSEWMPARIVCPKCEAQSAQSITGSNKSLSVRCPKCREAFHCHVAIVRAKNSRGNRSKNTRYFNVRIHEVTGGESLVEFTKSGWGDIELRSRDVVVFTYWKGRVAIVQNLTINRYDRAWRPVSPIMILILCAVLIGIVVYCAAGGKR
jgi:hypothetical protein